MTKTVITAAGKPSDICNHLHTLRAIFGKGATLADVATVARYAAIIQAEKKQLKEIEKK